MSSAPTSVSFICDAHVHFYPEFSPARALLSASANLDSLLRSMAVNPASTGVKRLLLLTERLDCDYFGILRDDPSSLLPPEFEVKRLSEDEALEIVLPDRSSLFVFAGRQIVTAERLELLALTVSARIPDGQTFAEALQAVKALGGVPVLNWAPGKWLFERERLVSNIISSTDASELLLGDTTLRPPIWTEPRLMRKGSSKGLKVIAGSDPLPLSGEESLIGTYGIACKEPWDESRPLTSLRAILLKGPAELTRVGERSSLLTVFKRLNAHHRQKRALAAISARNRSAH